MKNNSKKVMKMAGMVFAVVGGLWLCIFFMDIFADGMLADWFENMVLDPSLIYDSQSDQYIYEGSMIWWRTRKIMIFMAIIGGAALAVTGVLCTWRAQRQTKTETIQEIVSLIQTLTQAAEPEFIWVPQAYVGIQNEMLKIREAMHRSETALKDESQKKNDLITYLAHDLKTPLTSVIGYLSLLDEAGDMPPGQREKYTKITLDKACRLENLINEFFEITRYNLSSIILEKTEIDLYFMLVQLSDEFYPILESGKKRVVIHGDENVTVYADPEKLARVFNNILKNAAAYSYEDSDIDIFIRSLSDQVEILFRNTGRRIPENRLQTIFEKFFRMDESRATNSGGAGLGLAIAKDIVELHGGRIKADSNDQYTTFTVTLPKMDSDTMGQDVKGKAAKA